MGLAKANTVVQDESNCMYDPAITACIHPEHLEAGHDCATPDTFDLLQSVTQLLRQVEVVATLARNHYRVNVEIPGKYRAIWHNADQARTSLAQAKTLLQVLWKEQQR